MFSHIAFLNIFVLLANSYAIADSNICKVILNEHHQVYVAGQTTYGRIKKLTRNEYIHLAERDAFDPRDFVIVDEFPTEVEPQVVAGVLSGKPFEHSHMNGAAEKARVPLLYSKNIHEDPVWATLAENPDEFHLFQLDLDNGALIIEKGISVDELRLSGLFTLPKIEETAIDRTDLNILSWKKLTPQSFQFIGDKSIGLLRGLKTEKNSRNFPPIIKDPFEKSFPNFLSVSFGNYFEYINEVKVDSQTTLSAKIQSEMKLILEKAISKEEIPARLKAIRNYFDELEIPEKILDRICKKIQEQYGTLNLALRFRSDAKYEDQLGAGIYNSVRLEEYLGSDLSTRKKQIAKAIREVWKSLYQFHSFQTRQLFSLNENNVAMGILIHPSIDHVIASGVATYQEYYGDKVVEFRSYSKGFSATNPEKGAKSEYLKLVDKSEQNGETDYDEPSFYFLQDGVENKFEAFKSVVVPQNEYEGLHRLFKLAYQHYIEHAPIGDKHSLELGFEWVLETVETPKSGIKIVPRIIQIKELNRTPITTPRNFSYLSTMTEPMIAAYESIHRDPELDSWFDGQYSFADYFMRKSSGTLRNVPFFFIEVDGKTALILGQDHAYGGYDRMVSKLKNLKKNETISETYTKGWGPFKKTLTRTKEVPLNAKIIEMGRFYGKIERFGNKYVIQELSFLCNGSSYVKTAIGVQNYSKLNLPIFIRLLQSMVTPGLIEFDENALFKAGDWDDRYFHFLGYGLTMPEIKAKAENWK